MSAPWTMRYWCSGCHDFFDVDGELDPLTEMVRVPAYYTPLQLLEQFAAHYAAQGQFWSDSDPLKLRLLKMIQHGQSFEPMGFLCGGCRTKTPQGRG